MRRLFALALLVLVLATPVSAQVSLHPIRDVQQMRSTGYQQLTVSTTSVGLTVPAGTLFAVITIDPTVSGIRYRDDGTAPTATVGMVIQGPNISSATIVARNIMIYVDGPSLGSARFIRKDGADVILNIDYYGV